VLKSAGVKLPAGLAYVPFDLDAPDLESSLTPALVGKGFRPGEGALFVWEGVIGYIDDAAIDQRRSWSGWYGPTPDNAGLPVEKALGA
jgi:O-methyltransferase involved in polyketide biosynthesis